jgi:hypothetical protein
VYPQRFPKFDVPYTFLHPTARTLFEDWEGKLWVCVTHLRALSGLEPDAPDLTAIVGELVLKSPEFAGLWRRYDVHGHTRGHKTFHHPEVGDLMLGNQSMTLNGTPGQALIAYYAEPGPLNTTRSHFSIARTQTTSASLTSDASTSDPCPYCAPDRP